MSLEHDSTHRDKTRDRQDEADDPSYRPSSSQSKSKGQTRTARGQGRRGKPSIVERQWAAKRKAMGLGEVGEVGENGEVRREEGEGGGAAAADGLMGVGEERIAEIGSKVEDDQSADQASDKMAEGANADGIAAVGKEEGAVPVPSIKVEEAENSTEPTGDTTTGASFAAAPANATVTPSPGPLPLPTSKPTPTPTPVATASAAAPSGNTMNLPGGKRQKGEITPGDVAQIQKSASYW
jgi:hypothetical protein